MAARAAQPINMQKNTGSILILALWSLAVLAALALNLGLGVRQKITLIARLEERVKLRLLTEAGIKKAVGLLTMDQSLNSFFSAPAKSFLENNELEFKEIALAGGHAEVSYEYEDGLTGQVSRRFGVMDEEGKLNLNTASVDMLKILLKNVFNWDETRAAALAESVVDWREFGEMELSGFYSDGYYENLKDPYPKKNAPFDLPDELLLIQGMDGQLYERLLNYVTIYGEGRVNINTASRPVLLALGIEDELVNKILTVRRGPDGVEATKDDYVFQRTYDVAGELKALTGLKDSETARLDRLNQANLLDTNSRFYSMNAYGRFDQKNSRGRIRCVFNVAQKKVVYWREES